MAQKIDENKIKNILNRNITEVIERESLEKRLRSGAQLRIKHGVDPTTSRLHLGHASIYHKLRDFQELGHKIIFLIGDFTARFGDPTGKGGVRALRGKDDVMALVEGYKEQVGKILDITEVEIRYNGEWYDKMTTDEFMRVISHFTTSRMLERDMFVKRIKNGVAVYLHELLYPALQAYDSVMLQSDVTVIGSDQFFNEMQARHLQEKYNQHPQDIVTLELMLGISGKDKMSQSLKNNIDILDDADTKFGKVMSIPDNLTISYWMLGTRTPTDQIIKIEEKIKNKNLHPMEAKEDLAYEIVRFYHGEKNAKKAKENFQAVFQKKDIPEKINEISINSSKKLVDILIEEKIISSKAEFRRLIKSNGIIVDKETVTDPNLIIKESVVVRVGKLKFLKINKK